MARSYFTSANKSRDPRWAGYHLWGTLSINTIIVLNFISIICATIWFRGLGKEGPYYRRIELSTNAKLFLYTFTMPIITGILAPVGVMMALKRRLTPLVALKFALLVLFGWINQVSIWLRCEVIQFLADGPSNKGLSFCPTIVVNRVRLGSGAARPWIGLAVVGLCCCYSGICKAAMMANKTRYCNKKESETKLQEEAFLIKRSVWVA